VRFALSLYLRLRAIDWECQLFFLSPPFCGRRRLNGVEMPTLFLCEGTGASVSFFCRTFLFFFFWSFLRGQGLSGTHARVTRGAFLGPPPPPPPGCFPLFSRRMIGVLFWDPGGVRRTEAPPPPPPFFFFFFPSTLQESDEMISRASFHFFSLSPARERLFSSSVYPGDFKNTAPFSRQ